MTKKQQAVIGTKGRQMGKSITYSPSLELLLDWLEQEEAKTISRIKAMGWS